jgi:hypothetical protein
LVGRSLVRLRRRCLLAVDARRLRLDLPLSIAIQDAGASASAGGPFVCPNK